MLPRIHIHLVGDAILDNFYTLTNTNADLRHELINLGYEVTNYAVDETKVKDMLTGITPAKHYVTTRSYPYFVSKDGKIYQLQALAQQIGINKVFTPQYGKIKPIGSQTQDNLVVISMGGNNIYSGFMSILFGVNHFMNSVITKEFIRDYESVIETVWKSCHKIILVSIYLPYLGSGSPYRKYSSFSTPIMERWNAFLNTMGEKYNIPVLDLSRTLNAYERTHYGTTDTHPSNIANACMAACISYIYTHYTGYHTYYAPQCNSEHIICE